MRNYTTVTLKQLTMWTVHYRVFTQGAWRITSKTVKADSLSQAKVKADIFAGLIIKIEKI
jgi:hypothetical protein